MPVVNDYLTSVAKGVDKSGLLTIIFILLIMILIFRSPVTPIVSLVSVGISYLCSMGVIGVLINMVNFPVTSLTQMFVIIILFGIGTDYHILLFNRFKAELGTKEEANERTLRRFIHPDGVQSCQLVMGFTQLKPGSIWNTMPCHTHDRRMEVYLYFDMTEDSAVFHFMGEPTETRHIVMRNEETLPEYRKGKFITPSLGFFLPVR
jgi:hypothetical protein